LIAEIKMHFSRFGQNKSEIIRAFFFSVLLHVALVVGGAFTAMQNSYAPPTLAGMNLVWISLGAASPHSGEHSRPVATRLSLVPESVAEKNHDVLRSTQAVSATASQAVSPTVRTEGEGNGNYSSSVFSVYPAYGENMPPPYPEIARRRGYEGVVLIAAEILPDGHVGEVKIKKSSGYSVLDQSALDAVKPWKFEPAKKGGQPVTMWVEVPIKFVLKQDKKS